jgi:hypothetical protein
MNTAWQTLIAETAEIRRTPVSSRDSVMTYVSAFQVPEAFRQIESDDFFILELQYMDEGEGTRQITMPNGTKVTIGKQSGRVFGLRLPKLVIQQAIQDHLAKSTLAADAVHALNSLSTTARMRPGLVDNYRVTESLLRQNAPRFG